MAVERIDPLDQIDQPLLLEHYARYAFAGQFASGRRVLDIACGTGYGASLLRAFGATSVVGVDIAPDAVQLAAERYASESVSFAVADAHSVSSAVAGPFDLITSFETLEHLADPDRFIGECAKLATADAVLVASVPNEPILSGENPYHVQAFDRDRFTALLRGSFSQVTVLPQYFALASVIDRGRATGYPGLRHAAGRLLFADAEGVQPDSFLAVCSNVSGAVLFGGGEPASVHGRRFWEYQRETERAKSWLEEQRARWQGTAEEQERRALQEQTRVNELTHARDWLAGERTDWQRVTQEHLEIIGQRDQQIRALEDAKAWLEEQRASWQRVAEEHVQLVLERDARIRALEKAGMRTGE